MEKKIIDKKDNTDFNKFETYENLLLSTTDLLQDVVNEKINPGLTRQKIRKIITFITDEIHDREKYYMHLISYIHGKNQFNIHCLNTNLSMGTKYCNIRWTDKIEDYYEYGISFITPDNKITEECAKYLDELV